jgi:hypothetical protein
MWSAARAAAVDASAAGDGSMRKADGRLAAHSRACRIIKAYAVTVVSSSPRLVASFDNGLTPAAARADADGRRLCYEHHVGAAPRGRPWAGVGTSSCRIALLRIAVCADPSGLRPAGAPLGNRAGSVVRAWRRGLHCSIARCVPIRAGSAPRAPRWGTLTVPQTPPQLPSVPRKFKGGPKTCAITIVA